MNTHASGLLLCLLASIPCYAGDQSDVKNLKAKSWKVPGIELEMNRIPAGTFIMGSPTNEMCRRTDERQHQVTISHPFYIGVYEVTQRQFYKLMMPPDYDYDAWQFKRGPIADGAAFCYRYPTEKGLIFRETSVGGERTDLNPMECVTWQQATNFCSKITYMERAAGRLPDGYVYRLPTEAEWEYACRAGSTGPYNVKADYSKLPGIRTFAWVDEFNGVNMGTCVVGGKRMPNAWGLYDMHGNVYEWCLDWYAPYDTQEATNPAGPAAGTEKIIRGSGFSGAEEDLAVSVHPFLRSASRYSVPPDLQYLAFLGFRVVLAPELP